MKDYIDKVIVNKISGEIRIIYDLGEDVYILDDYAVIPIKTFKDFWEFKWI